MDLKDNVRNLIPSKYASKLKKLEKLQKEVKELKKELETMDLSFRDNLTKEMASNNLNNLVLDELKVVYVKGTIRKSFDKDKFASDHPRIYKKYIIETDVSGYVKISLV